MSYASQNVRARNFVISPNKQTTYGTALLDAALTRRSPLLDPAAFGVITKAFWSDAAYTGKGTMWPTVRSKTEQNVAFQQNTPVTAWLAAWLAAFALGSEVVVGSDSVTSGGVVTDDASGTGKIDVTACHYTHLGTAYVTPAVTSLAATNGYVAYVNPTTNTVLVAATLPSGGLLLATLAVAGGVVTPTAAIAAAAYVHTCQFLSTANEPPVTTLYTEDTADVKTKFLDMAMEQITLTGPANGPLMCNYSMTGSGRFIDGAMASLPTLPAEALLLGSDTSVLIGAPGGAVAIPGRVRSWQVDIKNNLVLKRAPGGGMYAMTTQYQVPTCTMKMSVAAKDTDDLRTLFINDTLQEVQINTNSGAAAQLNIKFPGLYLSAAPMGVDGKEIVYSLETDQNSVLMTPGNQPLVIVATNSEAAYLVGA